MLFWLLQSIILSVVIILVIHNILHFFTDTLTTPKVKDLVYQTKTQYKEIDSIIHKQEYREKDYREKDYREKDYREKEYVEKGNERKEYREKEYGEEESSKTELKNFLISIVFDVITHKKF